MGLFSNFFGGDSRRDIRRGQETANNALLAGNETAQGYFDDAFETSQGYLDPYIESGAQGQSMYADLLGINGAASRGTAQNLLMSDPAFRGQLGQDQNAMLRAMNARGMSGSGAGALAAERVFQQNYGNTLNRYAGLGQQGQQAASAGANLATNYGQNSANLQYGTQQQIAGNAITSANAVANTRNTGINNMLGLVGLNQKAGAQALGFMK